MGTVHQVAETTRGPDQHVAAAPKVGNLVAERGPAVDDRRTQHRAVAEATGLVEDLGCELARRRHDDDQGLGANAVGQGVEGRRIRTRSGHDLGLAHELRQHGDQESGRLAGACGRVVSFSRSVGEDFWEMGTGLSRGENVVPLKDGGDAVRLDGRAHLVAAQLDVLQHDRVQPGVLELHRRGGSRSARRSRARARSGRSSE